MEAEPYVVDVDDTVEADSQKLVFVTDKEKAALNGVSVAEIAETIRIALEGSTAGLLHLEGERNPLRIELRLPRPARSRTTKLAAIHVKGQGGNLVPLAELGRWLQPGDVIVLEAEGIGILRNRVGEKPPKRTFTR